MGKSSKPEEVPIGSFWNILYWESAREAVDSWCEYLKNPNERNAEVFFKNLKTFQDVCVDRCITPVDIEWFDDRTEADLTSLKEEIQKRLEERSTMWSLMTILKEVI